MSKRKSRYRRFKNRRLTIDFLVQEPDPEVDSRYEVAVVIDWDISGGRVIIKI